MARKQHLINVHTSTNTTAPTGASLYLGEIAVQHTPNEPALWIKMGSAQTSNDYEKFIGETEIMTLIEDSKILGSGYTYSGLSYVNSATTIADAYSALTNEMILNEKNVEELINENEEIIAGALNILSNRIGTVETQMTGDYIPITGYELASGTSEEELALSEEDTVNEAFGKLQKQMLDNEEAVAAGFNYFRNRFDDIEEEISHSTGVTALSGAVVNVSNKLQALSAVTEELSAATQEAFGYIFNDALPGLENDLQALSASVESISAKTSGVLTLSLNGVEQGKYSPSASTTIDLEVIQEVTGDDVLLTGYELATGSTEADLAIVATDTVNEAFGKLQKQNYDNEAVVAGALNDIDERINELSGNTGGLTGASLNSTPLAVSNQVVTIPVTVSGSGIASASVSGSIADAKAVKEYVEDLVSSSVDYKGATGSTPASAVKGDLYIASADFLIGSDKVETGDFIIYNGTGWDIIEKNLDGAITGALTANTVTLGNSANSIKSLANGTAGQVLTMGSSAPEWSNLPVLSSATTGTGNVVTSILVNGHEITYAKDFTAAANADLTSLSASVVDNENNISALSASVIGNKNDISAVTIDLDVLSGAVESIDYVVAQSLNSLNDRIAEIEGDSGLTALSASVVTNETDIVALSASVIDNEETISALTASLIEFSGAMEDTEYVVAQTFNSVNGRLSALEGNSGLTSLSASVVSNISNVTALSASVVGDANKVVGLSASVVTNESNISALSASVVDNKEAISALTIDLDVLSGKVEDDEYVIAQAFNTFNDRINAIEGDSGLTALSASVVDNKNGITALSAGTISEFKQKNHNIPYVVQSGSVFTGTTAAYVGECPDLDELVEGQSIVFWTKRGSKTGNTGDILSACTLNLQLSDGTMTGPKIIYLEKNVKVTTHIEGANNVRLTYHENATWSGVTGLTGWWLDYSYDANTDVFGYQLRYNSTQRVTTSQMYRYRLMFTSADKEHWVPANSATSTNATDVRTPTTTPIDPFGPIAYYGTTTAVVSGASPSSTAIYTQISALTLGYSFVFANSAMTAKLPVYLKCDVNDDGSAVIDATTPVTQTLPTSEDGKLYIFLGVAANATTFEFYEQHPVYEFKNGHIRHYQEDTDVQMILGSGYTYDGIPYVNSATSIADAYSALTMEVIDNEYVVAQSLNNLNEKVISVSGLVLDVDDKITDIETSVNSLSAAVIDNEEAISAVTGDLNVLSGVVESMDYVVAQSLNNLNDRVGTIEDSITVTQNKDVYIYGIGGYDGTNPASASTLQEVIGDIETILASI